jgi:uncharacterized membrane protein
LSATERPPPTIPADSTFPPTAYEQITLLLRTGVVAFLVFASCGLTLDIALHPGASSDILLMAGSGRQYASAAAFASGLLSLQPAALILFGLFVMAAVTVGRVILAAVDFYRGGERILCAISVAVTALLLVGLFVVGPLVG